MKSSWTGALEGAGFGLVGGGGLGALVGQIIAATTVNWGQVVGPSSG